MVLLADRVVLTTRKDDEWLRSISSQMMMIAIVHASERVHADVRRAHGEGHHRLAVREPPLLRPPRHSVRVDVG